MTLCSACGELSETTLTPYGLLCVGCEGLLADDLAEYRREQQEEVRDGSDV